jgi:hypothetical protein
MSWPLASRLSHSFPNRSGHPRSEQIFTALAPVLVDDVLLLVAEFAAEEVLVLIGGVLGPDWRSAADCEVVREHEGEPILPNFPSPVARTEAAAGLDGRIYMFGSDWTLFVYDTAAGALSQATWPAPSPGATGWFMMTAAAHAGRIHVMATSPTLTRFHQRFDPLHDRWDTVAPPHFPVHATCARMAEVGGELYFTTARRVFLFSQERWTELDAAGDVAEPANLPCAADENIVVQDFPWLRAFNVKTRAWRRLASLANEGFRTAERLGRRWILSDPTAGWCAAAVRACDPETGTELLLPDLSQERRGAAAATVTLT